MTRKVADELVPMLDGCDCEAFKKLKSLSKRTGDKRLEKLLQLFADHPDFDERIEHMRKRAKSDGYL